MSMRVSTRAGPCAARGPAGWRRRQPGESGSCCGPCPALSPRAAPTLRAPLTAAFQPRETPCGPRGMSRAREIAPSARAPWWPLHPVHRRGLEAPAFDPTGRRQYRFGPQASTPSRARLGDQS